jgi:tetratricopeptide (TPR) repeat protein
VKPLLAAALVALAVVAYAPGANADPPITAYEHARRARTAFNLGRYLEAAMEYEQAYEQKEDPSLLFNIGQAYRLAGKHEAAVRVYKSFLHQVPNTSERADVERRIAELTQLIERERRAREAPPMGTMATPAPATPSATTVAPVPSGPRVADSTPWYHDRVVVVLGAVGAAVAIAGAGLVG